MKFAHLIAAAGTAVLSTLFASHASAAIVINEIDSDSFNTPSSDYAEFIELYSTTGMTTSLDGLTLALINGNGDVAYGVLDLTGQSTNAQGYYLVASNAYTAIANNTTLLGNGNILQNGADAVALYNGTFAVGGAATSTNLLDAIVYGTADADDAGLLATLGQIAQYNEGDATPPSDAANRSLGRSPDGTGAFAQIAPTPGTANVTPEPATLGVALASLGLLARRRRA